MPGSLSEIYTRLRAHFGALTGAGARRPWWPLYGDDPPLEIVVGAVLVQQTRWETVEAAVLRLIAAGLLSAPALAAADPLALAQLIRPAAFHSQKAPGLIAIAQHICEQYKGSTAAMLARPSATVRAELLALPRVGRETCDVIMLYAGDHVLFVIDEYTRRLFERVQPLREQGTGYREQAEPQGAGRKTQGEPEALWRQPYELVRHAIELELVEASRKAEPPDPARKFLASWYADYHAQINEECVRYCLARPRCDGPPARRVYSVQEGRESYQGREDGCPLRPICAYYLNNRGGRAENAEDS